jgi:hypothetical protein
MRILAAGVTIVAALFPLVATAAETVERAPSLAKVFEIAPDDPQEDFLCPAGVIQSVLATTENRVVTVILLDANKTPIAQDVWGAAAGFRLRRKPQTKVRVMMFCGS